MVPLFTELPACYSRKHSTKLSSGGVAVSITGRPWHAVGVDEVQEMMVNKQRMQFAKKKIACHGDGGREDGDGSCFRNYSTDQLQVRRLTCSIRVRCSFHWRSISCVS